MSQEDVEIVRRFFDAVNRRDAEEMYSLFSEEGEFHSVLAASEGRSFHGHQGVRDYFAWFDEAFEEFRINVEEIIEAGEHRVLVLAKATARGRGSGMILDQPFGIVTAVRDQRVARMDSYFDQAAALQAAGLQE